VIAPVASVWLVVRPSKSMVWLVERARLPALVVVEKLRPLYAVVVVREGWSPQPSRVTLVVRPRASE